MALEYNINAFWGIIDVFRVQTMEEGNKLKGNKLQTDRPDSSFLPARRTVSFFVSPNNILLLNMFFLQFSDTDSSDMEESDTTGTPRSKKGLETKVSVNPQVTWVKVRTYSHRWALPDVLQIAGVKTMSTFICRRRPMRNDDVNAPLVET